VIKLPCELPHLQQLDSICWKPETKAEPSQPSYEKYGNKKLYKGKNVVETRDDMPAATDQMAQILQIQRYFSNAVLRIGLGLDFGSS